MDVLVDSREVLRNDALLLLIQLTKGHANLQKIVAFENAFDKLVDIVEVEGYSDGGIVVEDCLRLMLNLLRNNASNQTFFREGSYIQRIGLFFDLDLSEEELEVGWAAQKVSNMLYMLSVVRTLVSPSNPTQVTTSCQNTINSCGLLNKFCNILMAAGIPADILTESISTLGECIRGNEKNQIEFGNVTAPSEPPRSALILLLMSMVNEKQPFELRCAILYCLQCYLHKHPGGQTSVMTTLLPKDLLAKMQNNNSSAINQEASKQTDDNDSDENDEITAGQLLCGGLFSNDSLSNWFSAVALAHGMMDQEGLKVELLKVQVASKGDERGPVSLLEQCLAILQSSNNVQTRIGILMLISNWVNQCLNAASHTLATLGVIPFLTGQIGSNEHDEMERLSQGLCAFLLGLLITYNDNSVPNYSQDELMQLIEKRIGFEVFMDKLSEVTKHEAYNRALKHPQLKVAKPVDLVFDNRFCTLFKQAEHLVINHLSANQSKFVCDQPDPAVLGQYKELIREQDTRISEISKANIYLQQELAAAKASMEEMSGNLQTLQDQNALLKAQTGAHQSVMPMLNSHHVGQVPDSLSETPVSSADAEALKEAKETIDRLEKELKVREDIIHELEVRITLPNSSEFSAIEIRNMQSQLEALHAALATKDEEIERLKVEAVNLKSNGHQNGGSSEDLKATLESVQAEQEDLLIMLSDQDGKLKEYRKRLKALGQPVEDDDEDELDLSE